MEMEMVLSSSSAHSTSYAASLSLGQAVVKLSISVVLFWLSAVLKFYSSSSSSSCSSSSRSAARRRSAAAAPAAAEAPAKSVAGAVEVDLDVVLGVMGGGSGGAVGFEEAAALFEMEEATVEEAAAAFRVFDRDGNGFIDAGELGSVLRSLGFAAGAGDADCQCMIDAYDEDKDGRIDFQEFLRFMERGSS